MFTVYAIKSKMKNYIYFGMTQSLAERLLRHNSGREKTTKPYLPFGLIYSEKHQDRIDARRREKYLSSGVGKEFIKKL
jgi:putative endonuclease